MPDHTLQIQRKWERGDYTYLDDAKVLKFHICSRLRCTGERVEDLFLFKCPTILQFVPYSLIHSVIELETKGNNYVSMYV